MPVWQRAEKTVTIVRQQLPKSNDFEGSNTVFLRLSAGPLGNSDLETAYKVSVA